ncbi:hypothetical protein HYQ45_017985 [Verticillium longisporum]|uniref:Uncharacterized protein n=1 Tax=Verticillium longisporum TaxID=100787 RepID=A0A8I2Z229_VERLO|nr:hypothetical protein HYQ45_017985 [Verticillium longisporum]
MKTLIPPHFVLEEVSRYDIIIASLALGFTIGFGWLTTWTAAKQTKHVWRRHGMRVWRNAYVWMIWLEIAVCLVFAIICFLYLLHVIPPSFAFYFTILTMWALQVQFLLQIIVNRCAILMTDPNRASRLKWGIAALITLVNISVYCIWIPARLQISERYVHINEWWDRCEKGIYLIVDAMLNLYFIHIVKKNLIMHGLTKYRSLVRFNMFIVGFSLSMDVFIIGMMSLGNSFVYMQVHPLAYIVKLNIEMSMADLIGKIARNRNCGVIAEGTFTESLDSSGGGVRTASSMTDDVEADLDQTYRRRVRVSTPHGQHQNGVTLELTDIVAAAAASAGQLPPLSPGEAGYSPPPAGNRTFSFNSRTGMLYEVPPAPRETYVAFGLGRDGETRSAAGAYSLQVVEEEGKRHVRGGLRGERRDWGDRRWSIGRPRDRDGGRGKKKRWYDRWGTAPRRSPD